MLFGIGGVLLYMDWRLGLIMVAPVPVFLYAIYWHGESMQKVFLRIWRKWSRMTGLVSDTLPGMKVVKAFNRGSREEERFDKRNAEVLGEAETLHQMWTSFWPKLMFMIQFCIVAVWYFAPWRHHGVAPHQLLLAPGDPGLSFDFVHNVPARNALTRHFQIQKMTIQAEDGHSSHGQVRKGRAKA